MLVLELDRDELFSESGRDEVDHRPSESDQQAEAAGEVRDHERHLRGILACLPCDHRFDGELGHGLQPRENRERQPLRNQKLRRLGTPCDRER